MTFHNPTPPKPAAIFWLGDVLAWAEANNESYDAIRELYKIPARMQMNDNDIGLIPASVEHFDKLVAPTAYGVVSNADDLEKARRRGNSRARTLLVRFHTAMGIGAPRTGTEKSTRGSRIRVRSFQQAPTSRFTHCVRAAAPARLNLFSQRLIVSPMKHPQKPGNPSENLFISSTA